MNKRYWWVIITYIIMQLSSFPVALTLKYLTSMNEKTLAISLIVWAIFSFIAGLVIVLLLMRPFMKIKDLSKRPNIGMLIVWGITGLVMAIVGQNIAGALEAGLFGVKEESENTLEFMNITRAFPVFIIIPTLIAPALEEIIFRKIIFGSLYRRMNFFFAAGLSAIIFALVHQEPEHILVYASMGFVFAFIYVQTNRIIMPIIVHMAMNSFAFIAQLSMSPEELREQIEKMQTIVMGG